MRNYIILNGKNSNQINGLLIQELPPISKPLLRNQIEEIDGRDGDIVTPLGYSAYDKEFTIGLYKDFDVNEVAAYFNSEGTVIFSNEPDKYYYYQITAQIDFERLVRYRTATVTMHCQPFKYSATEQPITEDVSGTVSDEGTNFALENTAEAPFNTLDLKGNTEQDTLSGKNLAYPESSNVASNGIAATYNPSTHEITITGTATATWSIPFLHFSVAGLTLPAGTYMLKQRGTLTNGKIGVNLRSSGTILTQREVNSDTLEVVFTIDSDADDGYLFIGSMTANQDVSGTITVQLEAGSTATDFEPYCGGIQSPNPDYSQPIQTVTGSQTVEIVGNNLFDGVFELGSISTTTGVDINDNNMIRSKNYAVIEGGENYTISVVGGGNVALRFYQSDGTFIGTGKTGPSPNTFTAPVNAGRVRFVITSNTNLSTKAQCEKGSSATTWNPYSKQTYPLDLGNIELCKLGTYQDYIWKDGDRWKVHRENGKVTFNGTEAGWNATGTSQAPPYFIDLAKKAFSNYCDGASTHFKNRKAYPSNAGEFAIRTEGRTISFNKSGLASKDEWLSWLRNNNVTAYYPLDVGLVTDTAITNQNLIEQLDDIYYHAHAYKGRTHISSSAATGNMPLVISAEVVEDNESTITNSGNYLSKPRITVYGSGDISLYINDMHVLQITLGDEGYITIDTAQMEAYKDTIDNLKNRLVIGDYSNARLKPGANKIHFTGKVTKYVVEDYSRWL